MRRGDKEKEFRLRPRKPHLPSNGNDGRVYATAFKRILHFARTSRKGVKSQKALHSTASNRSYFQRCSVRVSYSRNSTAGQWRAHGRYVERETATYGNDGNAVGFDRSGQCVAVSATLASWQAAGDQRLWKLIISPEFGDRLDLERLTRDILGRMEQDTRSPLQWVAVAHYNTEHPHVHVALRGRTGDNQPLDFSREYVKNGIREAAENLCTRQIGPRTMLDAAEAERREVQQKRLTSLDRRILANAPDDSSAWFIAVRNPARPGLNETGRSREQHASARLAFLGTMGLAESVGPNTWRVRRDFTEILRAMQRTSDHQKMLSTHGVLMSDERLPIAVMDWSKTNFVEGRILVHGQEEASGRSYLMLEGTDAKVHLIHYTPEIERARRQGAFRTNSFVGVRRTFDGSEPRLELDNFGNAEDLLHDERRITAMAQQFIKRDVVPIEDGWGGWLGRYQAALRKSALQLMHDAERTQEKRQRERQRSRNRSLGR